MRHWWLVSWGLLLLLGCAHTAVLPTPTAAPNPTAIPPVTPTPTPAPLTFCSGDHKRPLTYLALGDSYTIGENVAASDNFPAQLTAVLQAQNSPIDPPTIIAQTGWTTADLLDAIEQAALADQYDLVTLLIGVNNQYRGQEIDIFAEEFQTLLAIAIDKSARGADGVIVLSIPDWGASPFAHRRDRDQIASEIDAHNALAQQATAAAGATFVNVTDISRRALVDASFTTDDFLHPSAEQYGVWVESLLPILCSTTIKSELTQGVATNGQD